MKNEDKSDNTMLLEQNEMKMYAQTGEKWNKKRSNLQFTNSKGKKKRKKKKGFIANKKNGIKWQKNEKKTIFQDLRL